MSYSAQWLPEKITQKDFNNETVEKAFEIYHNDFVRKQPIFDGLSVIPFDANRNIEMRETFSHIITKEAYNGDGRQICRTRCCAIPWIAPIIEHSHERFARVFFEKDRTKRRICIWYVEIDFVIVLTIGKNCYWLTTAYTLDSPSQCRRLKNRYDKARKHYYDKKETSLPK